MNNTYTTPVLVSIIGTCFGIIWAFFTFYLYPYFINRPRLFLERKMSQNNFHKTQTYIGLSPKNGPISEGPEEDWYIYQYEWDFNLIIHNNSEYNAFDIKLFQNKNKSKIEFRERIDFNKALLSHKDLTLSFRIFIAVEIQGKERENYFNSEPEIFNDLNIILEYKNPKGKRFYSNYDFKTNKTFFERFKQKDIKSNWVLFS